jgi:transposase
LPPMRVRTVLNQCYKFKSFVYRAERWEEYGGKPCVVVDIEPRKNSKPVCSGCHQSGSVYDHQPQPRYFEFVPLWGIVVYFCYLMRRVNCQRCGVKVEAVPWCDGKNQLTKAYQLFLARWARRLSWKEVADTFQTSWDSVFRSVRYVVEFGLKHRDLTGIEAIGVDEIHYKKGQNYLTLVYQLDQDNKRLLYLAKKRTVKSLLGFFRLIGKKGSAEIKFVCSDMWPAYLKVIKKKAPQALNILDRFHIVAKLNDAVDSVRKAEVKSLAKEGYEPILKESKYCFLKREENLTEKQKTKLNDLLQYDLKTVRAHLLKESFQAFWEYNSPYWAEIYLKLWCARAMRSQLDPMKKFVKTVRKHQPLMMNWFKAKKAYSSGTVEGLNRKINLVTRKAYGYRSYDVLKMALFHTMGALPEPEMTHRFC